MRKINFKCSLIKFFTKKTILFIVIFLIIIGGNYFLYKDYQQKLINKSTTINKLNSEVLNHKEQNKKLGEKINEQEKRMKDIQSQLNQQQDSIKNKDSEIADLKKKLSIKRSKNLLLAKAPTTTELSRGGLGSQETFHLSFYTPYNCGGSGSGITKSGKMATPRRTVAVDTNYWPLGTKFYIEGFGTVIAEDTGGAIRGRNRMDVCVDSESEANQLGRKIANVYVIR